MKKNIFFILFIFFMYACSSAKYSQAESAITYKTSEESDYTGGKQNNRKSISSTGDSNKYSMPKDAKETKLDSGEESEEVIKPKLIYGAQVSLEVRDIRETQDKIVQIMENSGGFIEAQMLGKIVIRIPSEKFNAVLKEVLLLGQVLNKIISTYDISNRYFDLQKRLTIAEKSKERLLNLLLKTIDIREKIKIIQEIERLTKEIETYKKILNTMDSFVNYSIIEIYLKTPEKGELQANITPFDWINKLTPEYHSLSKVKESDIIFNLPPEYVIFDKEDFYIARNPTGSFIRIGKTKNNPLGDNSFWKNALDNSMNYKNYEKLSEGKLGNLVYTLFEYKTLKPFYYLIALTVKEDEIYIIEVFFPDKNNKDKNSTEIIKKLEQFRIK